MTLRLLKPTARGASWKLNATTACGVAFYRGKAEKLRHSSRAELGMGGYCGWRNSVDSQSPLTT